MSLFSHLETVDPVLVGRLVVVTCLFVDGEFVVGVGGWFLSSSPVSISSGWNMSSPPPDIVWVVCNVLDT